MIKPISYSKFCKNNKLKPNKISLMLYNIFCDGFMQCLEQVTIPNFNRRAVVSVLYECREAKLTLNQTVKKIEELIYKKF
jgi:hypothetical protein